MQPLEEIGRIAEEHDITCHTDAVQSVGKIPVDVERLRVDLLSLSAHKLHGPKGVGALYIRRGTVLRPLLYGGHHERDRRPGTENVPGIVGLGKAAEIAGKHLADRIESVGALRERLGTRAGLLESYSPLAVLRRGYGAVRHADGRPVRTTAEVQRGDALSVRLADGSLDAEVRDVRPLPAD